MEELLVPRRPTASASLAAVPTTNAVIDKAGAENFPVASRLLPKAVRAHLLAIYGFARLADDIGDEAEGDRLVLLGWLEAELDRSARGEATHPLLQRLTPTIDACDLPLEPFRALIEANRRDQVVHQYETFDDLVDYCRLSAAPVGRLVLAVFGASTPARVALSDDVCIGLQVVEHLQDVAEDAARGRTYLPQNDLRAFGCTGSDFSGPHAGPRLRAVIRHEAGRARRLLGSAAPLARELPLRTRFAVCGFAAGGLAALSALERADYDVLGERCRPRPLRLGAHLVSTLVASSTKRPR
jgi:squalene synthase HpnC